MLDAYVQIGYFLTILQSTGDDIVGRLIDVSDLDKIYVDEVYLEDKNYFVPDNGSEDKKYVASFKFGNQRNQENMVLPPQCIGYIQAKRYRQIGGNKERILLWFL